MTDAPASPGATARSATPQMWMLAAALCLLSLAELYRLYVSGGGTNPLSQIAFLAIGAAFIPHFTLREWLLTGLAAALSLGIWLTGDRGDILAALNRAAFFAAFIYLVTLLKEAAQRSRSVLDLGRYLTHQPQGRRYFSLSIGGHIMGVLLNFGAISLLTPLIQRGAKAMATGTGQPTEQQLEQQQISALLRGFSWMIMWAPTALTQAVLFTSFPQARASIVIPLGLGATVVMILLGRALNRIEWRHLAPTRDDAHLEVPRASLGRFGGICATLICATFAMVVVLDVRAAIALMLVAPVIMILWVYAQQRVRDPHAVLGNTRRALRDIFVLSARPSAQSAYVLGLAGFVGVAAAALAPVEDLAQFLDAKAIPPWVILAALPALITLGGQFALSPILMVVFLAAVLNELPALPADPNLIVFSLGAGWALSMTASPNASATLLISSISRIAPTTLTWRWNGRYAALSYLTFVVFFFAFGH